jgi:hypothetical protein
MSKLTPIQIAEARLVGDVRGAPRKRVLMQATLMSVGGSQQASIKDLTSSGARVRCEQRLEEGWDVVFKRGDLFIAARVAWATRDEAGLEFYRIVQTAAVRPAR